MRKKKMKRRTYLTASLILMLILSITAFYITPASACRRRPEVEIWKKFLDTSDPPPYQLKTEYHWDIEIGIWTSVDLKCARVYDRFGAELKIDNIKIDYEQDGTIDETYEFNYPNYEEKYPTWRAEVTINGGEPQRLNWRGVRFGDKPYKFRIYWTGKSHKIHFQWIIGELAADTTVTIIIGVSTDLNPGGQQEYTSPCEHCINSGAVLKAKWEYRKCRWRWLSAETEELCIKVECGPTPATLNLDKFNDINGNGVYDAGDIKIADWSIQVMDPYGVTTTYNLMPTVVEITEFGTYTITEDLPDGWEQTAVEVDGVYKESPTLTVMVDIDEGETHSVLYGNRETPPPPPARLIVEKFNDTDGNGFYDVGVDVMITDWQISVTDPDDVTTSYSTLPISLEITKFGDYNITEDLPEGWEQTALFVDGGMWPISPEVILNIKPGEEYSVLYGNQKLPPPKPPKIKISLGAPIGDIPVCTWVTFTWAVTEDPPGMTVPLKVTVTLEKPDGTVIEILYEGTEFPEAWTGEKNWHAETPGDYIVKVFYEYTYEGIPLWAQARAPFGVK
jgi:hypothetical protein